MNSMDKLPGKYQELKMLDVGVSPEYLLFLFDYDFSLSNLRKFFPSVVLGDSWEAKFKEYSSIVEGNIG